MTGKTATAASTEVRYTLTTMAAPFRKALTAARSWIIRPTSAVSSISATTELFESIADKTLTVRRITIAANRVVKDEGFFQVDLFTDTTKLEKEKKLQNAMLGLKKKFGKNAVLKGTNYLDGATMRERNQKIGGHKAE